MKTNYLIFIVIFSKTTANVFLETSDEEQGNEWYDSKELYSDSDILEKDIDNIDYDSDFEGNWGF